MSRETISILHLSDIHFRKKEKEGFRYFQKDVIQAMLAAIEAHVEKHGIPDFAAVTGDIAFDGRDYKKAAAFFNELKRIMPGVEFLPVPGNHDVDREEVGDFFSLHDIVKEGKVDRFLENKKSIRTYITPKFKKFRAFVETHLNPGLYDKKKENKDDYFWVKDFPGKKVRR